MSTVFYKRISLLSVSEIKDIVSSNDISEDDILKLEKDSRISVNNIAISIRGRHERDNNCQVKMAELRRLENKITSSGKSPVCGIDEAGRGPLAGPVVSAAVILPEDLDIPGLDDSKKLKAAERERLYAIIVEKAVSWGVGIVDNIDIDKFGILEAAMLSMRIAFKNLSERPVVALVDGNRTPGLHIEERLIISGDARCRSIAAASVIAKVTRDRIMKELDKVYPDYGFGRHMGYGSSEHCRILKEIGPCSIHRISFKIVPDISPREVTLNMLQDRILSCVTIEMLERAALSISRNKESLEVSLLESLRKIYIEHKKTLT